MKKNTIGKRIAEARINLNITQEQLEELSGFSVSTISRFETGRTQPSIENLIKLSKVLNVGIDYFLYDLIPHNETIQSPTVKDAVTVLSQMNERQAQYMLDIIKIYQASHQDWFYPLFSFYTVFVLKKHFFVPERFKSPSKVLFLFLFFYFSTLSAMVLQITPSL